MYPTARASDRSSRHPNPSARDALSPASSEARELSELLRRRRHQPNATPSSRWSTPAVRHGPNHTRHGFLSTMDPHHLRSALEAVRIVCLVGTRHQILADLIADLGVELSLVRRHHYPESRRIGRLLRGLTEIQRIHQCLKLPLGWFRPRHNPARTPAGRLVTPSPAESCNAGERQMSPHSDGRVRRSHRRNLQCRPTPTPAMRTLPRQRQDSHSAYANSLFSLHNKAPPMPPPVLTPTVPRSPHTTNRGNVRRILDLRNIRPCTVFQFSRFASTRGSPICIGAFGGPIQPGHAR